MRRLLLPNADYWILPGKAPFDFEHTATYEAAFAYWQQFWTKILSDLGADPSKLSTDDFLRQDMVTVLRDSGRVVSMFLYTLFRIDSSAAMEHSYFRRYYNQDFFAQLAASGVRNVMSMEFFSVHPDYRSSVVGASLGWVMAALGCRVARLLGVDAIVAAARTDVAAAAIAYKLGATPIIKNVSVNGCPTDLVAFYTDRLIEPNDLEVLRLVDRFWKDRKDTTQRTRPLELAA